MAFQNPGLEALHQFVTANNSTPNPAPAIEQNVAEQVENKVEIEEITKELQDDARLERPKWKGFG
ncbi:MAG: hypothetical protein ACO3O5_09940 [Burkholderiaceae bacterium]